ncbi:MAG: hypothetical protein GFH27_549293n247 [Chloroflexi bacterium AL-W]|nr:hypothetical protein [Chloroflexi bacterium AL-N1]NOK67638.1 hypothetical protein [Chloroflexi bacterium AL-N10]NOK75592.1 hypothetical protein [Chloroflexi bacterium AL-N5]NOK82380.1 hypothetical protein [Chloroflexi bacterium AL-W]NOK90225.1 hypothetical protein [Chloroflexi bacterium AL-N15]
MVTGIIKGSDAPHFQEELSLEIATAIGQFFGNVQTDMSYFFNLFWKRISAMECASTMRCLVMSTFF